MGTVEKEKKMFSHLKNTTVILRRNDSYKNTKITYQIRMTRSGQIRRHSHC